MGDIGDGNFDGSRPAGTDCGVPGAESNDRTAVSALAEFTEHVAQARGVREVLDVGVAEFRDRWGASGAFAICWNGGGQIESITGGVVWAALDPGVRTAITSARHSGQLRPVTTGPGVAVPLQIGARPVVLWLDLDHRPADTEHRLLLTSLCERLTQALTRARAFDDQRTMVISLQQAILGPTGLPPGFAVRYEPASRQLEVGGDWYDVVRLSGDRVGVVVGDCVGRGLSAAAIMGQLRGACRAVLLQSDKTPGQVLAALDDFAGLIPGARCTTVFCAIIDLATAAVHYSSAGHLPALLARADGTSEVLDAAGSVPLATMRSPCRPEATTTLAPGSTLLLYTDGLIENRHEALSIGMERARSTLVDVRRLAPEHLATRLAETLLRGGHEDDVAYLIYQHPGAAPEPFAAALPAEPHRLSPLRRSLRGWLATTAAAGHTADEIVLAVSEACANAIEHAHGFECGRVCTVTAAASVDAVEVTITDTGRWKTPGEGAADRGHGLLLMDLLMDGLTVTPGDAGTVLRLRKRLR